MKLAENGDVDVFVCVEVGSVDTARHWILSDGLAAAVSVAEHPGSSNALQLLRGYLLHHCRCRQLRRLLLQRPGNQPATLGPHQMVNTVSCTRTCLLQQSDCGGVGYNHSTGCDDIAHSSTVLYAGRSIIYYNLLVCMIHNKRSK